jgi:hypothetical protein
VRVRQQRGAQLLHDRLCDVVLHRKDVIQFPIVGLGPQTRIGAHVNQVGAYPHAPARLADAAFQDGRYIQLAGDRSEIDVLAFEVERRGSRCHAKSADSRKDVEQFFAQSICEVVVLPIMTRVREWQDRDRRRRR